MNVNKNIDVLLCFLWQKGKYTNLQIGDILGLTHSSVSRRVAIMQKRIAGEQKLKKQIGTNKSPIKP